MRLTVLQENLRKALSFVGKNVSTKTQLPVLSNILLETENGKLKLSSTNLETTICFWIGASIEKEGAITIPARFFSELVNSFTQEKIELSAEKSNLLLTCGDSEATVKGIAAEEFPPLPKISDKKETVLTYDNLKTGLPFVLISASSDEGRPILTGVKVFKQDNHLTWVATDGYRLSVKKTVSGPGMKEELVVPVRALSEVYRLMTEEGIDQTEVSISQDKNQIAFWFPSALIITRLIEGEYPAYGKIIPEKYLTRAVFDKEEMLRAIKFVSIFAKEAANILRFKITAEKVVISASSDQVGSNKTTLEVQTEGEPAEIAFNARFLLDLLAVFPFEKIVFEMNDALSPGVFKPVDDDSFLHIIMPVRIQE